jgi:hypothetical protein
MIWSMAHADGVAAAAVPGEGGPFLGAAAAGVLAILFLFSL